MRLSDSELRGRTVVSAEGQTVGEVASVIFDSDSWTVEFLKIKLRKQIADELGAQRGKFHAGMLDMPVRMVQSVRDTVVLSVSTEELRKVIPGAGLQAAD